MTPVSRRDLERRVDAALGREPADLVIKGARWLCVPTGELLEGDVAVAGDTIVGVGVGVGESYEGRREVDGRGQFAVPGFIDTHVHVESSLVTPAEFARCVLPRGTTTAVCDPHEIANVLGLEGIRYVLDSTETLAIDLRVQLSSCVPATAMETSGAHLTAGDLEPLRGHPAVLGLAEMMNFPGVFRKDPEVLDKLAAFQDAHIDGHCPLVRGRELSAYAACGIRACHESTEPEEGREKLRKGMQVLMREGTASQDVAALAPLLTEAAWPFLAFCTDDRNPLAIDREGHIDHAIRTAIAAGARPVDAYRAATWAAARAFGLRDRGVIAPGYRADIVLLDDLETCAVGGVIRNGRPVGAATFAGQAPPEPVGRGSVRLDPVDAAVFAVRARDGETPVIGLRPGSLLTDHLRLALPVRRGERRPDPAQDVQKLCVLARHGTNRNVGRGFVKGFGLRAGAFASTVGHDSHNVAVVGVDDGDMAAAVNRLIELQGGFVAVRDGAVLAELALPIAGLMSERPYEEVCRRVAALREAAGALGCTLGDPFQQLAFLPLAVIPHLKLTDHGLVDVDRFELVAA